MKKITNKNIFLMLAGLIALLTIVVITLNVAYLETRFKLLDESSTTLIFSPGYKVEIDNKPIAIFGEDVCENTQHNLIFSEAEKPHFECIRIRSGVKNVLVHLVLDKNVITEQWEVHRDYSPEGVLILSLKRPNGEYVKPFNKLEKNITNDA